MERVLTRNFKPDGSPVTLAEYEAAGGYSALRKALRDQTPDEVVRVVTDANLRGRGGAGFPTGRKWAGVRPYEGSPLPRLIIVNLDEMEPGTFKDRYLVENDPHQLLEGLLLAAYACRAEEAVIFIRAEYLLPVATVMEAALAEARRAGYVGRHVMQRDFHCEVKVHMSAGRYMCGESTGIINATEGKRAIPRTRPPRGAVSGAWGKPTVVNNVETFCCVPHIVNHGAEWFRSLGRAADAGTKIYGVSGRVKRPGSYELPMGTPLRELLEEHAGGMQDGYRFKAALPGGASTTYLDASELDVPLDFTSLKKIHADFGTGTAIIVDDATCIVGLTHNLQAFYARESCGWCTPCREGLPWLERLYADLEEGTAQPEDLELLDELGRNIRDNTFCALGLGAILSVESSLRKFRDEYEAHFRTPGCPYRKREAA